MTEACRRVRLPASASVAQARSVPGPRVLSGGARQPFVLPCPGRLVAKKGKITLVRESINTVAAAQALNPNGAADLPPPESEIFSVPADYLG
jgi:hypothetical protein